MQIKPIKTRPFLPPKDDLLALMKKDIRRLSDGDILVITSKIVSIWQGQCIKISNVPSKDNLIKKESDFFLPREKAPRGWVMLTIRDNLLIPTAGIDESNANGYYILWPRTPFAAAKKIYNFIKKELDLKKLGVIISDSHTTPLRWGTMGVALAYWGFWPLRDYRGTSDIFGRKLKMTQSNIADSLAASAVVTMGEGKEQTPIAIIRHADFVKFGNFDFTKKNPLAIGRDTDIYAPLLSALKWEKSKN
jgi:dihydrofolate synthase / folylpolyglutamate synthase